MKPHSSKYIVVEPAGLGAKWALFWRLIVAAFASLCGRKVLIELNEKEWTRYDA